MTEEQLKEIEHDMDRDGVDGLGEYQVRAVIAEVRRLRQALRGYGSHSGGCALEYRDECTCGFRKALEEGR